LGKETAENLITFIEQKVREEAGNIEATSILMERPLALRKDQQSGQKIIFWIKFCLLMSIIIAIEVISVWMLSYLAQRK